jgi:hypothetical protein
VGFEKFRRKLAIPRMQLDANSYANQSAGITALASGTASIVISTSAVRSNSIIMLTSILRGAAVVGSAFSLHVNTITHGGFFSAGWNGGGAYGATTDIAWVILLQE